MAKSRDAFRTISEVAEWLDTPAHVLRFWESKFTQVKPVKRAGGRRYYRPEDMMLLSGIKVLLHDQGMTIKGAQKLLREQGVKHVSALGCDPDAEDGEAIEGSVAGQDTTPETMAPETKAAVSAAPDPDDPWPPAPWPEGESPTDRFAPVSGTGASAWSSGHDADAPAEKPLLTLDLPPTKRKAATAPKPAEPADILLVALVKLQSERRKGRIPALPTNPGAFARPGPLSALATAKPGRYAAEADTLTSLLARLRAARRGISRAD